jgi:hypothetical protein
VLLMAASAARSKAIVLGVGVACAGAVLVMGVYLPFYSGAAQSGAAARRDLHVKGALHRGAAEPSGEAPPVPGGVWKNIQRVDEVKKQQQRAAPDDVAAR